MTKAKKRTTISARQLFAKPSADPAMITRMRASWNKSAATLREQHAVLLASCVLCMLEHGNATPMQEAIGDAQRNKSVRTNAIVKWALGTGVYRVVQETVINPETGKEEKAPIWKKTTDKKRFKEVFDKYSADKERFGQELVKNSAYVLNPPGNPYREFDLELQLFRVLEGLDRFVKLDDTKKGYTNIPDDLANGLRDMLKGREKPDPKARKDNEEENTVEPHVIQAIDKISEAETALKGTATVH